MTTDDIDLRELVARMGPPGKIAEELKKFDKSVKAYHSMRTELLQNHPKEWVALYDGQVVGFAETLPKLLAKTEKAGVPRGQAYVEHLEEDTRMWFL